MKTILTILFIIFSARLYPQTQQWAMIFNGSGNSNDEGLKVVTDASGNSYVTGRVISAGSSDDFCTIKYSAAGTQLWASVYNSGAGNYDEPMDITIDNSGNVYVTGNSLINGDYDIVTVKYDNNGSQQWAQVWDGAANFDDNGIGVYADNSGNIYVTGSTEVTSGVNYNYVTVKYNSGGVLQWAKQYNSPLNSGDFPYYITGDANNVYVTGLSSAAGTGPDMLTVKYSSNGDSLWVARYSGTNGINEIPAGIAVDASGNVYAVCRTQGTNSGTDFMTVKYNSNGVQQWNTRYTSPNNSQDIPEGLAIDGAGNVYVTGRTRINSSYNDFATIKYNAQGIEQWAAIYNNNGVDRDDYGYDIITDAEGNVYVTGNSQASGSDRDVLTIKYSSSGAEQWVARYDVTNSEEAYSIALDASNNVIVCGYQQNASSDFLTIKYSQANGITPVSNEIPANFSLGQNYPNPFNPVTNINFSIPKHAKVKLRVLDMLGKEIAVLVNGDFSAGTYRVDYDGSNLSSGIYFYTLEAGGYTNTRKMILVK